MNDKEKIKILSDIIAIESVNNYEIKVANYLRDLLKKYDIYTKIIKLSNSRANFIAEIGNDGPILGVSGHMDVVSPGNLKNWKTPPFKLTEDAQGNLHGRGSADMKSGLAALVISLIEINEQKLIKKGKIRLLATVGEEIEGNGAKAFQKEGYMEDVDALVIAEPSQDEIIYAHKGSMDIRVTSIGKSVHSSMPELGYNALNPLVEFVCRVNKYFSMIKVKNNVLGETVVSPTILNSGSQVNSIPDYAVAEFNIRTIPEADNHYYIDLFDKIKMEVESIYESSNIDINVYMNRSYVLTKNENNLINLAKKIAKKHLGKSIPGNISPGVTDASDLLLSKNENFPFIMFGPGQTSQAHRIDEFVEKDIYLKFIDIFIELFPDYINSIK
ncbi:ArgE/DapE family deacylase [Staphylococcus aureus]|uniref:ArgE/DapE family deacylase n=1 Tax=Staphylococcus aureus TaxID=1280 RepID=UPI0018EBFB7A|nr:ArgE/DapE family deacylase [Staphylococcus aureus]MBJ6275878.1 ArgE/DapE family deacylase [Staphylococcus aureus]MBJ6281176.1 ArgE/DapE family deacylase [Staphylococcus aureus]MBJ6283862.1 ArgE/DapE family deacylase [Staphylococcus aureus]MBJ6286582.1 ArgE/DapE family deacylase [Staphylococcus aureus]MBJ6289247.1 ArgE/DapE family deacylase [Staphylococcus aureus]